MKKSFVLLAIIAIALVSCFKDNQDSYQTSAYKPILMQYQDFINGIKQLPAQELDTVGKLQVIGNTLLAMETYYGLHLLDISDPTEIKNTGFVAIPGVIDFTVKDSTIYANSATDLVTLNFNGSAISLIDRQENVFYELIPPDNRKMNDMFLQGNRPENTVIVGWTTDPNVQSDSVIYPYYLLQTYDHFLYSALGQNLLIFDIQDRVPQYVRAFEANYKFIEKFAIKQGYLYAFSMSNMMVSSLSPADNPVRLKEYIGINAASYFDVIYGSGVKFFVTFHFSPYYYINTNSLQVYDLGEFAYAHLDTAIGLTYPLDLLINDSLIYVCDQGLKLFKLSDQGQVTLLKHVPGQDINLFRRDSLLFSLGKQSIKVYNLNDTSLTPLSSLDINFAWAIRF